jgi:hypothetical protein
MRSQLLFVVLGIFTACKPDPNYINDPGGAPASGNSTLLQNLKPVDTNAAPAAKDDANTSLLSPEQQAAFDACMASLSAQAPNGAIDTALNKTKCLAQIAMGSATSGSTTGDSQDDELTQDADNGGSGCNNQDPSCRARGPSGSTVPTGNGQQTTTSTGGGGGMLSTIGKGAMGIGKGAVDMVKGLFLVGAPTGATGATQPTK